MKLSYIIAAVFLLFGTAEAATNTEVFSNSAVYLSFIRGNVLSYGSGFILARPNDRSVTVPKFKGDVFLVTNKHVLPPEGAERKISMRVTADSGGTRSIKTVDIPIVGADGKYLNSVRTHATNDVAAVVITKTILENNILSEIVPTRLLGTKDKLKKGGAALVGDEVYILGYPAGLFDDRNAYPIWRIGIIATDPQLGYAFPPAMQEKWGFPPFKDGFLIDSHVYPGASGGVVVVKPQAIQFDSPGGITAGGARSELYVLGIVSNSIPVVDTKLNLVTRMGLGVVESADAMHSTIESFFK